MLAFGVKQISKFKFQALTVSFENLSFRSVVDSNGGYSPTIPPDGKTAAYRDENEFIWVVNLKIGSHVQLRNGESLIKGIWLKFAPDSNYLYFNFYEKEKGIFQVPLNEIY